MQLAGTEITVLGAGVAGLALALALTRHGARVTVLEQAEAIREVGAGLQVSPNGAAVLRALGLQAALESGSVAAQAVELRDGTDDSLVARLDMARLQPGRSYRFVHRADLVGLLEGAARAAGVTIRLLQRIDSVTLSDTGARLTTAQGEVVAPGLVFGADGLHSRLRAALNGDATPFFTGQIAWRALVPAEPGIRPVAEVHMGQGRHLVSYPLRGGTLRNIVAVEERSRWVEESWSLRDDPLELRVAFETFSPRVRGWLDGVQDCWLWGLFRHPVAATWGWTAPGRPDAGAAILGDAAHPTLPFLAQGANMALEDAWSLADALHRAPDLGTALAGWRDARATRCARIVAASGRNARAYHLDGIARDVAHLGLRTVGRLAPGLLLRRFDWIYGHDVTAAR